MTITTIAVVGHGLIGGSIALAARSRAPRIRVITLDRDDPLPTATEADLIILSAPVRANIENLRTLRPIISSRTLVTDTGSTKVGIVSEAAGMRFIGGHPVAGATTSGAESARPDLFVGRRWILTPGEGGTREDVTILAAFVQSLGAVPQTMGADEHDRLFAYLSHLPQLTISALMHVIGEAVGRDGLAFAGRGLHDSSRLASSAPTMWRDILADNHTNLAGAIDSLIGVLQTLRSDISGDELAHVFESARRARSAIEATEQH